MYLKVAVLCCLGITAIHAKPLYGSGCIDVSLSPSDPLTPTRTIRICEPEIGSYVSELEQSLLNIDVPARHLLPPKYEANSNAYPAPAAPQQHYYHVINKVLPHEEEPINFQPLEETMLEQQMKLKSIAEDVSTVKESVSDLENYLKTDSGNLETQEKDKKIEMDLNIVMKLDPALEELLKTMFNSESDKTIDSTAEESSKKESEELDVKNESIFESEEQVQKEEKLETSEELEMAEEIEELEQKEPMDNYAITDEELLKLLNNLFGANEGEDYVNSLLSSATDQNNASDEILKSAFPIDQSVIDNYEDWLNWLSNRR